MTMPSMKSTMASTRLRTPFGASSGLRREAMNRRVAEITVANTAMRATLLKVGKRSRQRMTSLIGGNSRANIDLPQLVETRGVGLRPGKASDDDT